MLQPQDTHLGSSAFKASTFASLSISAVFSLAAAVAVAVAVAVEESAIVELYFLVLAWQESNEPDAKAPKFRTLRLARTRLVQLNVTRSRYI